MGKLKVTYLDVTMHLDRLERLLIMSADSNPNWIAGVIYWWRRIVAEYSI